MKRFRKALGIVALALVASLALAMPVSAWADETESYGKPDVSGPQSAWYDGQSHHFRSTVKDSVSGKDLVEGTDYTRSFGFLRDRGNADDIDTWLETDDSFASSGFVYERIDFKGNYAGNGSHFVRHNILTLYEFKELDATKVEGEADPTLGATLSLFVGDPTTLLDLSAFILSREAGEQPASTQLPIRPIRSRSRQLTRATAREPARALAMPTWAMAISTRWWSVTTSAVLTTSASSLPRSPSSLPIPMSALRSLGRIPLTRKACARAPRTTPSSSR